MQLVLQLKRLGKKRVTMIPYQLADTPDTLSKLISACVEAEVIRYNERRGEVPLVAFLNPQQIQERAENGKISFGELDNLRTATVESAVDVALSAYRDGLFAVFIDGVEVKALDAPILLGEGSEVAFIRMTFLAGRMG